MPVLATLLKPVGDEQRRDTTATWHLPRKHDRGAASGAVIEQLQQLVALARTDRADLEVIDDDDVDFGDGRESLAEVPSAWQR
jgi:hypothetical protein